VERVRPNLSVLGVAYSWVCICAPAALSRTSRTRRRACVPSPPPRRHHAGRISSVCFEGTLRHPSVEGYGSPRAPAPLRVPGPIDGRRKAPSHGRAPCPSQQNSPASGDDVGLLGPDAWDPTWIAPPGLTSAARRHGDPTCRRRVLSCTGDVGPSTRTATWSRSDWVKDMIIRAARTSIPSEIENFLYAHVDVSRGLRPRDPAHGYLRRGARWRSWALRPDGTSLPDEPGTTV